MNQLSSTAAANLVTGAVPGPTVRTNAIAHDVDRTEVGDKPSLYSEASRVIQGEEVPATNDDVIRLRTAYDALRSGDVTPLEQLMDEKIRWIGSERTGDPPAECNGREEAAAVLKNAVKRMPAREIESVSIAGDRILAVAQWQDEQGPPGIDRVYNVLTVRDGRIVKMEDFFDRAAAERAFSRTA